MDVYNHNVYHSYNQSEELAKQMLAQQALTRTMPYNPMSQEPHYMPAPSGSPWNPQGVAWGLSSPPDIVQFTAQQPAPVHSPSPIVHCKRKSLDLEPVIPAKKLITEEKMVAHLNSLHISSDYTSHCLAGDEDMDMESILDSIVPTAPVDKLKGRVVLSEELKKITEEPLLPAALIERLEKPRMSLVLWKPKEEILKVKTAEDEECREDEDKPVKRNGLLVTENCTMDVEM